jgi:hypothetical protein
MFNIYSVWSSATTTSDLSGSIEDVDSSMSLVQTNKEQSLPSTNYPSHPADTSMWSEPPINQPNVNRELPEVEMHDEDEDNNLYADAREQVP